MIPENLIKKILPYLDIKSSERLTTIKNYKMVRKKLGSPGVFDRAANIILNGTSPN
jgi:hypothetical protein